MIKLLKCRLKTRDDDLGLLTYFLCEMIKKLKKSKKCPKIKEKLRLNNPFL